MSNVEYDIFGDKIHKIGRRYKRHKEIFFKKIESDIKRENNNDYKH